MWLGGKFSLPDRQVDGNWEYGWMRGECFTYSLLPGEVEERKGVVVWSGTRTRTGAGGLRLIEEE